MIKTVYICGASDCCYDSRFFGQSWHELLAGRLSQEYKIHNLAIPGASNFLIRLQIDRAIESGAHAVLINFTSSVRTEIALAHTNDSRPLLDRFYRYQDDLGSATLLSLSRIQSSHDSFLSAEQQQLLIQYQLEFFDLDCAVQKNYYIIQGALSELCNHDTIKFCYSLGGFEHPDYMTQPDSFHRDNLSRFEKWMSRENLWNYFTDWKTKSHNVVRPSSSNPLFHINDPVITNRLADYYKNWIESI